MVTINLNKGYSILRVYCLHVSSVEGWSFRAGGHRRRRRAEPRRRRFARDSELGVRFITIPAITIYESQPYLIKAYTLGCETTENSLQ